MFTCRWHDGRRQVTVGRSDGGSRLWSTDRRLLRRGQQSAVWTRQASCRACRSTHFDTHSTLWPSHIKIKRWIGCLDTPEAPSSTLTVSRLQCLYSIHTQSSSTGLLLTLINSWASSYGLSYNLACAFSRLTHLLPSSSTSSSIAEQHFSQPPFTHPRHGFWICSCCFQQ